MKKILLLVSLFVLYNHVALSQQGYWFGENFISLSPDNSSKIFVKTNHIQSKTSNSLYNRLKNNHDLFQRMSDNYCLVSKAYVEQIESLGDYVSYIYKTPSSSKVIVLPEILVSIKEGYNVRDLMKHFPEIIIKRTIDDSTYVINSNRTSSSKVLDLVSKLSLMKEVKWCEPDMLSDIKLCNPFYSQQYYLKNTGQTGGTHGIDINVEKAWNLITGSSNITVAVIDQGVDRNHPDLNCITDIGYTAGYSSGNGEPINANVSDCKGHGIACAGIIAAIDNSIGIKGVASGVKILPVNICPYLRVGNSNGFASNEEIADAIEWAYQRADILSCSWGGGAYSSRIVQAITKARTFGRNGKGTIVVFAAGNSNSSVSDVFFPANVDGVITVGAINKYGNIWGYSQRGASMDLVAPSGDINSRGDIVTTDRVGSLGYSNTDYTEKFGGTSAACPQVAGVAALMLSVRPDLTENQVRTILQQTARDLGTTGFDNTYGYGLLDAYAAVIAVIAGFPTLSGSDTVCNSSAFNIENFPTGCTVHWSVSNNCAQIVSGQGTESVTLQRNYDGWTTLTATISHNGTVIKTLSKDILVVETPDFCMGIYPVSADGEWGYWRSDLYGNKIEVDFIDANVYSNYIVDLYRLNADFSQGPRVGHWTRNSLNNMTFGCYPQGWYYIEIVGVNDCGTSSPVGTEIECVDGSWGMPRMFSFNYHQDSEMLIVTQNPVLGSRQAVSGCEIQLWNGNTMLRKYRMTDGKLQIPMSGMKGGLYIVRAVTDDGKSQQHKLMKK